MTESVGEQVAPATPETPVQQETTQPATTETAPKPDPVTQLAEKVANLESLQGKQAEELGRARNEAEYYRQQASQAVPQQGYQPQPWEMQSPFNPYGYPQQKPLTDETFLTNPLDTVQRMVESGMSRVEGQRQRDMAMQRQQEAMSSITEGYSVATRLNPDLFKGIENESGRLMGEMVRNGWANPYAARNPENWEMVAQFIHMRNKNFDRITPKKIQPTAPVETQRPNQVKQGYETEPSTANLEPSAQNLASKFGLEDKDIKEALSASRRGF